ncbi:MAG: hypothetical protein C0501_19045 [Isosphaera sp.]|nr:hypothetical protein [Isosphaera sp.]
MSRTTFALLLGLVVGCGSKPQPEAAGTVPLAPDPPPPAPGPPTPPAPVVYEMDPARQVIPDGPVRGRLAGVEIGKAEVSLEGRRLVFRGGEEWRAVIDLPADPGRDGAPARMVLRPADEVPGPPDWTVFVVFPRPVEFEGWKLFGLQGWRPEPALGWRGGCGITLEFGRREGGKLPGKVFLALPDLPGMRPGTGGNVLAGSFVADCPRQPDDPPGPDDVPYVNGAVAVRGAGPGAAVRTGYFGALGPDRFALAAAPELELGSRQTARSNYDKPHVTTLVAGTADAPSRFEHSRLTPGRYLVFAALRGGPVAGRWVEVKPGSTTTTADLVLDPGQAGGLEVTPPLEALGKVQLVPADDPGRPPLGDVPFEAAALQLGLEADIVARKAVFKALAPGRYEVRAAKQSRVVEVAAGKVAELDFGKK